jgi:hypothetical protein
MYALVLNFVTLSKSTNTSFLVEFSPPRKAFQLIIKLAEKLTRQHAECLKLISIFQGTPFATEEQPKERQSGFP